LESCDLLDEYKDKDNEYSAFIEIHDSWSHVDILPMISDDDQQNMLMQTPLRLNNQLKQQ